MIIDRFVGFIANVVDIKGDGVNYGKVKIRILGDQGESVIADSELLWALIMMPTTSAAESGIGTTPNWLVVGSTVVGYFLDGKYRNIPMIVGTLNQNKEDGHGITKLANGDAIPRNYNDFEKELGVEGARKPNYNDNKIITTAAKETPETLNHIIEIDDTQQSERILIKHKNGSYVEFLPNGTVIIKGIEAFAAVANQVKLRSILNTLIKSGGDADILASKNISIVADGELTIKGRTITIEAETINMIGNTVFNGDLSIDSNAVTITASTVAVVGAMTLNGRPVATVG